MRARAYFARFRIHRGVSGKAPAKPAAAKIPSPAAILSKHPRPPPGSIRLARPLTGIFASAMLPEPSRGANNG